MKNRQTLIEEIKEMMVNDEVEAASAAADAEAAPKKAKKKGDKSKVKAKVAKKADKKASGKADKKAAPKKKVVDEEGQVSLATLAEEAELTPAVARRKLRDAEIERGDGRWSWKEGSGALKQARKALGLAAA